MASTALSGTVGDFIVLKSFQVDAYGLPSSTAVTWTSDTIAVATVQNIYGTNDAMTNFISAGTATITATMGAASATFSVTVRAASPNDGYKLAIEADLSFQSRKKF